MDKKKKIAIGLGAVAAVSAVYFVYRNSQLNKITATPAATPTASNFTGGAHYNVTGGASTKGPTQYVIDGVSYGANKVLSWLNSWINKSGNR